MMVSKVNYPKIALFKVGELSQFTQNIGEGAGEH